MSKCLSFISHSTDASSTTGMKCEIKSTCSSSVCQQTNPMTVFPGSNVTLNCSIVSEGLIQGMTWKQTSDRVKDNTGLPNLILERSNSTTNSGKRSCQCTTINFTRRCFFIIHPWYLKLKITTQNKQLSLYLSGSFCNMDSKEMTSSKTDMTRLDMMA